jgi:hypothetical protein
MGEPFRCSRGALQLTHWRPTAAHPHRRGTAQGGVAHIRTLDVGANAARSTDRDIAGFDHERARLRRCRLFGWGI